MKLSKVAACDGILYSLRNANTKQEAQGYFLSVFQDQKKGKFLKIYKYISNYNLDSHILFTPICSYEYLSC